MLVFWGVGWKTHTENPETRWVTGAHHSATSLLVAHFDGRLTTPRGGPFFVSARRKKKVVWHVLRWFYHGNSFTVYMRMYILCLVEANKLLKPTSHTRLAFKMKDHYGQWRLKIHDFRYGQERGFHKGVYTLIVLIINMSFSVFSSKGKPQTPWVVSFHCSHGISRLFFKFMPLIQQLYIMLKRI